MNAPDTGGAGTMVPPSPADIADAARVLEGQAVATPLHENHALNALVGGRVLLKAEVLQRTGSFKFRGAYNFLSRISETDRTRGVVAYSSGNHAQGVAAAAASFGVPATIVMPADAPAVKLANTRALGAEVVTYDRDRENREAIGGEIAARTGATLVPPYDHPWTIAGQGTVGLEIARQCAEAGIAPDAVLVPCSGGGLASGIATALKGPLPAATVHTVEPAACDDTARSLRGGSRVANAAGARSICDALMAPTPGELTFRILRDHGVSGLAVEDDAVRAAVAYAWSVLHLTVEPGGAAGLAAVLSGRWPARGRTVVVVLSGGNLDRATLEECLDAAPRN